MSSFFNFNDHASKVGQGVRRESTVFALDDARRYVDFSQLALLELDLAETFGLTN